MMEGEIMNDSGALILDWVVETIDDEESIQAEDDGQRAEATCGGYLLVARRWAVSGEASWHVEAGFDETSDQPAGAGGDIPASSLRAAQLAAEAFVFQRLGEDPGVAALSRGGLEVIAATLGVPRPREGLQGILLALQAAQAKWRDATGATASVEAVLARLGGPGPDRGTLAERVATLVLWGRALAQGDATPAGAMSYGVDADALAAHDAAAKARARAEQAEARVATLEAERLMWMRGVYGLAKTVIGLEDRCASLGLERDAFKRDAANLLEALEGRPEPWETREANHAHRETLARLSASQGHQEASKPECGPVPPPVPPVASSRPQDAQAGIHVFTVAEFRRAGFHLGALRDEAQAVVKAAQGALDLLAVEPSPAGASKALARLQAVHADLRIDFEDAVVLLKGLSGSAKAPAVRASTMAEVVTTAASLGLSAGELGAAVATLQARDPR